MVGFEIERSADVCDQASFVEQALPLVGINKVREALAPEFHADFNGVDCVECGDPMIPERLAAKRVRCTHCQSIIEHKKNQFWN